MNEKDQSQIESAGRPEQAETPEAHHEIIDEVHSDDNQGLLVIVRDRMAGRWKYAIPLAIVLMVAGTVGGYLSSGAYYESNALIHIAPKKTPLLHETIETGAIPNFSAYVNSQAALLTSARVRERAISSLDYEQLPYESRNDALRAAEQYISAKTERDSELIHVSFRADTARASQEVLNAILKAYLELFVSVDGEDFNRRMMQLRQIRESVRTQVRQKRSAIEELMSESEFAVSDFRRLIEDRALRIQNLETELAHANRYVAKSGSDDVVAEHDADDAVDNALLSSMSGEEVLATFDVQEQNLEAFDPQFAMMARERRLAQAEYERARATYQPAHWRYQRIERDLERATSRYHDRVVEIMPRFLAVRDSNETGGGYSADHVSHLESEIQRVRQEARSMSNMQLTLTQLQNELHDLEDEYANVNNRIRQLEVESESIRAGNISVAAMADRPSAPSTDRRRATAVIGAMGGFTAGFGFLFLLGTIDRRAYAVRQLETRPLNSRILGVLPSLPERGDAESSHIAACCVHQIRNQIEAVRRSSSSAVIAISSPYQGDGKTSLTLALGASYAVSGHRTIILDGDITGRNLTEHVMLGQQAGLQETLRVGKLNGEIKELQVPNLSVLPVGADPKFGSECVRRQDLVHIFDQLRKRFEIILIDTGPLFGSVEGVPVASASDAVLMIIRRGRRQSGLEESIEALRNIGTPYLGVVLNHARRRDCDRYVSKSTRRFTASDNHDDADRAVIERAVRSNVLHHAVMMTSQWGGLESEK